MPNGFCGGRGKRCALVEKKNKGLWQRVVVIIFFQWNFFGGVGTMVAPLYYILTLYFEIAIERVIVCNILLFLLHPMFWHGLGSSVLDFLFKTWRGI